MTWENRYYTDRWNPYNRHDTGQYVVYRAKDGKHIGYVTDCHSDSHAERVARIKFGCGCYVLDCYYLLDE